MEKRTKQLAVILCDAIPTKARAQLFVLLLFLIWNCLYPLTVHADAADEDNGLEDNLTYHVYDDVDLVSTLKFEYGKPKIVVKLVYPQLASETEREGINQFNELVLQIVQTAIDEFRDKIKNVGPQQKMLPKNQIINNLYLDYNTSYLKTKREHIISIRFNVQALISGLPPSQSYRVLNYNLDKNQVIELRDLFLPGANYLEILSRYTYNVLTKQLRDRNRIATGTAPQPENFAIWNLKPDGLLISFRASQVAPNVYGSQTVLVPYSALIDLIASQSPIAYCVLHRTKCVNSHLVTGGFIDEASNTKIHPKLCQGPSKYMFKHHIGSSLGGIS